MNSGASLPAIRFAGVSFSYPGGNPVVSSLDLDIPAGQITAILGPNGTGKTTLLYLALGWLRPLAGTVHLFGADVRELSGSERGRYVSLLPQKEPTDFEYTVLEYVLLGRAPYLKTLQVPGEDDRQIADEALCITGIPEMERRTLPSLSGGETQLTLLSRSLTQDPDMLLLDEPTNHLDLKNRRRMIELLNKCKERGKGVVFTTHDPDLASLLADRLVLMGPDGAVQSGDFCALFTEEKLSVTYGVSVKIGDAEGRLRVLL